MKVMKRDITSRINSFLDNWVPPAIRDNKWFVRLLFRRVIGKKYVYYMTFKEKLPFLSETEINRYYEVLSKTFIQRETHCNSKCIKRIMEEVEDGTILDVAAGNGYFAKLLYEKNNNNKCTVSDIVLPNKRNQIAGIMYVKSSITNLPFEDNAFDTVICTHALEHIKDYGIALDEIRRVCRRKLLIVLPRQREYKYTYDLHVNFFPYKYSVEKLMNGGNANKRRSIRIELLNHDWMIIEDMDSCERPR